MAHSVVDKNFGITPQVMAVLTYLDREPDFAAYESWGYDVWIQTRPWYNGRERGVVLTMGDKGKKERWIHVAFFEHRNSDDICALRWETDYPYWNHPLEDPNIFDVAYGGEEKTKYDVAHRVGYGEASKMADWVYDQLAKFYKKEKKNGKKS